MTTKFMMPPLWAILPDYTNRAIGMFDSQLNFYNKQSAEDLKTKFSCEVDINDQTLIPATYSVSEGVGVLPIMGMIIPKSDFFSIFFGGFAALDILTRDFREMMGREDIHTIVMDIDSPGGNAFGVQQFANIIYEARNDKPIISVTSGMMASAAMWIGAAAHKVYITGDVTVVGSIGTVTTHTDISELNKKIGIVQTEIAAGEFKRVPSSLEPLSEKGRAVLKNQVEHANSAFLSDIGKFRNAKPSAVNKMGEGRTFIGTQGIKVNLIDGIMSMDILVKNTSTKEESIMLTSEKNNNFNSFNGGPKMTLIEQIANMKTENVDLYNAMLEKGKVEAKTEYDAGLPEVLKVENAKGVEAGKIEGKEAGVVAERDRITSIRELANVGNGALIEKFIADGKTTAPEAAVEILKAQKNASAEDLAALAAQSPAPLDAESNEQTDNANKGLRQLVTEYVAEHKVSKGTAIVACTKLYPNAVNDYKAPGKK